MPRKTTKASSKSTKRTTKTPPKSAVTNTKIEQTYSQFGIILLLLVACLIFIGIFFAIAYQNNLEDLPQKTKEAIDDTTSYIIEVNPKQVEAQEPALPTPPAPDLDIE